MIFFDKKSPDLKSRFKSVIKISPI